jgi:hypothetical protein
MQFFSFHFLTTFDSTRCDEDGKPASYAVQYKQKELFGFYCDITYSIASQISESSFKEYYLIESKLKLETRQHMEMLYQSATSMCITKSNLMAISKYGDKEIPPYMASTVLSSEFQIAMLDNMIHYRNW